MMMQQIETRLHSAFPGRVVNKALVRNAGLPRLPVFVVEHLVARYVQGEPNVDAALASTREGISQNLPEADNRELVKARLLREGSVVLIDKLTVEVNFRTGQLVGTLSFLGESKLNVPQAVVDEHPRLLTGGLWGAFRLDYTTTTGPKGKQTRGIVVSGVTPFQAATPDLNEFGHARAQFTLDEWIDVLLASVGYEPTQYSQEVKLTLLLRLLPVMEANVNTVELGPRQTGKTYLLRNVSPSVYTASGANISAASLFANASTGALGILANYKVVVLDEVAHTRFDDISTVSMLKDYMESGQFARGGVAASSDASMVLAGNLDVEGNRPAARYRHLFEALPPELQDTAFLDRVHAYIPGWVIPKVSAASISRGQGLIVDYLGQVFGKLRGRSRRQVVKDFELSPTLTQRDVVAVEKVSSALVKLLFPHDRYDTEELRQVVQYAANLRGRVASQLATMDPGEFKERDFTVKPKLKLSLCS
jgi:ATP-dependent Lon protease